jgi:phosphatidylcholine synthase
VNGLSDIETREGGWRTRLAGFGVHVLTASGAGVALIAALEAAREHWPAVFGWLGVALIIDGIDGPLARHLDVRRHLPNWSGETLDLVVDYVTYVFIPAYVIVSCRLLMPGLAPFLGVAVAVTGALYFADRRMKTNDNHFRGFPALWNLAAFYLLLLRPSPVYASAFVAALAVLTFLPIRVIHPMRVERFRPFNIALTGIWLALAGVAVAANFMVPLWLTAALCAIGAYFLFAGSCLRLMTGKR